MVIEEFTFHFYLFMPIDNVTWHARVGIFYTLKSLPKIKLNAKKFPVLTNPISFLLVFFLNVIILHLTNVQHALDRVLTEKSAKSYLCSITSENGENHHISVSLYLKFTYAVY